VLQFDKQFTGIFWGIGSKSKIKEQRLLDTQWCIITPKIVQFYQWTNKKAQQS